MHIAHIINNLPVGGAEQFLVQLTRAQQRIGLQPRVIALCDPNPLADALEVPFTDLQRRSLNDLTAIRALVGDLRRQPAAVVHTHLFYADTFGRIAARWCGIPCISTEHSTEAGVLSQRRQWGMKLTRRLAQRVVAVSPAVQEAVCQRLSLSEDVVPVIPNGIDLQRFESVQPVTRADIDVPDGALIVGCVGRIVASKGFDTLLRAVAQMQDASVHVVMVGDGPERQALEELSHEVGIDQRVRWLGLRRDVPALLATFDVFAMPSHWEGHSIALLEAMAAGCALVVSDIPELTSTTGDAALTIVPGQEASVVTALEQLGDAALRQRHAEAARRQVQRFSVEAAARAYQTLYNEVAGTNPSRPGDA